MQSKINLLRERFEKKCDGSSNTTSHDRHEIKVTSVNGSVTSIRSNFSETSSGESSQSGPRAKKAGAKVAYQKKAPITLGSKRATPQVGSAPAEEQEQHYGRIDLTTMKVESGGTRGVTKTSPGQSQIHTGRQETASDRLDRPRNSAAPARDESPGQSGSSRKVEPPKSSPTPAKVEPPKPKVAPAPTKIETPKPAPLPTKVEPPTPKPTPVPPKVESAKPAPAPTKIEVPKPSPTPTKVEPPKPTPSPTKVEPPKPKLSPTPTKVEPPKPTPSPTKVEPPKLSPTPTRVEPPKLSPTATRAEPPKPTPSPTKVEPPKLSPTPTRVEPPKLSPTATRTEPPKPAPAKLEPPKLSPTPTRVEPPKRAPSPAKVEPPKSSPTPTKIEPPKPTPAKVEPQKLSPTPARFEPPKRTPSPTKVEPPKPKLSPTPSRAEPPKTTSPSTDVDLGRKSPIPTRTDQTRLTPTQSKVETGRTSPSKTTTDAQKKSPLPSPRAETPRTSAASKPSKEENAPLGATAAGVKPEPSKDRPTKGRFASRQQAQNNVVEKEEHEPEFVPRHVEVKYNKSVKDWYSVDETLGSGKFGVVRHGKELATGQKCAIKFIPVGTKEEKENVLTEIKVMSTLQHRRLIQLIDAFVNKDEAALVMELITGGELFERVIDENFELTESKCVQFMTEVCEGVKFIHEQHVIHLDLKPENILCLDRTGFKIKIIDFGLARFWKIGEEVRVMFGTPEFVAPEVLSYDCVTQFTDMWSVGVICYVLLSGLSPFMGDSDRETFINITKAKFSFNYPEFDEISSDAKDFVKRLLVKDINTRMSAKEALRHKWLQKKNRIKRTGTVSKKTLKRFVYRRKWQKAKNIIVALMRMGVTLTQR